LLKAPLFNGDVSESFNMFRVNPIVAKVEDAAGPPAAGSTLRSDKHQGCSCSRLPQSLDNAGDAVSSAFPKGKQHGEKHPIIGNNRELYLIKV